MDTSDIIAIVAAVVAVVALIYARSEAKTAEKAVAESKRSADAGEKSAEAAHRAAEEAKRSADAAEESNRIDREAFEASRPPRWKIERLDEHRFRLRNTQPDAAHEVVVDASRVKCSSELLPGGITVPGGGSCEFYLSVDMGGGGGLPGELFVKCDEHPAWQAVPIDDAQA